MVVMDLWRVKIEPNFQKSFWNGFFVVFEKNVLNEHVVKIFTLAFIHMDFMEFLLKVPNGIHHDKWHQQLLIWVLT
jgi:hypothetical protein